MPNPRKPIEIKEREGTRIQPCRVAKNIARPVHSWPVSPDKLSAPQLKLWNQFCQTFEDLGVLAITDVWLIHELTITKHELDKLRATLKKYGSYTYTSSTGVLKTYPEVAIINDRSRHYVGLLSRSGLTPTDRMRVEALEKPLLDNDLSFLDS